MHQLLDWLKSQHVLPPALRCLRCDERIQLRQTILHDRDLGGYLHDACLNEYERHAQTLIPVAK